MRVAASDLKRESREAVEHAGTLGHALEHRQASAAWARRPEIKPQLSLLSQSLYQVQCILPCLWARYSNERVARAPAAPMVVAGARGDTVVMR